MIGSDRLMPRCDGRAVLTETVVLFEGFYIQKKPPFSQAFNQPAHGLGKGLRIGDDQGIKKIETYGFYS